MLFYSSLSDDKIKILKTNINKEIYRRLNGVGESIKKSTSTNYKDKSKKINEAINGILLPTQDYFINKYQLKTASEKSVMALIVQYCYTCISLEERHSVWKYEFMSFSRRIGELWERFCSVAWDYSEIATRFDAPKFSSVQNEVLQQVAMLSIDEHSKNEVREIIEDLLEIIGEINLKEDEMFFFNNTRYVIDFKSGFGSNEKGNMLRLKSVGNAYKRYDQDTVLLLLVRQENNNNYLEVLKKDGLWDVYTGKLAYQEINKLTGVDILWVIQKIVDFKEDLSRGFLEDLKKSNGNMLNYLEWI